jgi:tRNA threonylcarbamoyladenosine biosynthesis protein TsaB
MGVEPSCVDAGTALAVAPVVLAMDLSSPYGHLALCDGISLLAEARFSGDRSHHGALFGPLSDLVSRIPEGREVQLVVGTGPGSYTGVRIAVAAAQGLSLARGWPVVGLPSIGSAEFPRYSVIGDARRGQAYLARVVNGRLLGQPRLLAAGEISAELDETEPWVSFDVQVPFGMPKVELIRPNAHRLALQVAAMSPSELEALSGDILQPFYLQEAFITQPKGRGKILQG